MSVSPNTLVDEYAAALEDYVRGAGETTLREAYTLGRQALNDGGNVLEISSIHHRALGAVLSNVSSQEGITRVLNAAEDFFMMSLSSFEVSQRSVQASHSSLIDLNQTLEKRVEERTEKLRSLAERRKVIAEVGMGISKKLSIKDVSFAIVDAAQTVADSEVSRIYLRAAGGDFYLEAEAMIPELKELITEVEPYTYFRPGEGLGGWVVETGQSITVEDVHEDHRWVRTAWSDVIGLRSIAVIPIHSRDEVIGVFTLHRRGRHSFSEEEMDALSILASYATIAIENAEVHSRLEASFEELRKSQKIIIRAEKLSSLGTLTAGAAHEILNPANIIGLYGQRMLRESEEDTPEREIAEVIVRNIYRITRICDDLRRFSRNEAPRYESFDPNETVRNCMRPLAHEVHQSDIWAEVNLEDEGVSTIGNESQIEQVFFNLVNNAVDAMPEGGTLTLHSQILQNQDKWWWELRVTDTGIGIPEEIMGKIFDPFFTTKPEDKGTGLGLSVSYGIIEDHGGELWAESIPGKGTTFFVRLPLEAKEEA